MSATLFARLDAILQREETLQLTVGRCGDHRLTVLLQPLLKSQTCDLSDEAQAIRAELAGPLYLSMTAAELDQQFDDLAGAYALARSTLRGSFDAMLAAINAANEAAKAEAHKARQRKVTASPSPPRASSQANVPSHATAETPDPKPAPEAAPPTPPTPPAKEPELDLFSSPNTRS